MTAAINLFETTRTTIQKLVEKIKGTGRLTEEEIYKLIGDIFGVDSTIITEEGTIKGTEKKKLIRAIYNYQRKYPNLGTPDGIMNENGNTVKALELDIYQFGKTRAAIEKLVEVEKVDLKKLQQALGGTNLSYGGGVINGKWNTTNNFSELFNLKMEWVKAIYKYEEKKKIIKDGIMEEGDETYNMLKGELEQ